MGVFDPLTFTRASTAYSWDSIGRLVASPNNVPRLDYDPVTLVPMGVLIESYARNMLLNSENTGAVAGVEGGSRGTWPNNWGYNSNNNGISSYISSVDDIDWISAITVRIHGTATADALKILYLGPNTAEVVSPGDAVTFSIFVRIVSGTFPGVIAQMSLADMRNTGTWLTQGDYSVPLPVESALRKSRYSITRTASDPNTAAAQGIYVFRIPAGATVDFSVMYAFPMLAKQSFLSSLVRSFGTSGARQSENLILTETSWYSPGGTILAVFQIKGDEPTGARSVYELGNISYANRMVGIRYQPNNLLQLNVTASGASSVITSGTGISNAIRSMAQGFSPNNHVVSFDGNAIVKNTNIVGAPPATRLYLGRYAPDAASYLNGWIRQLIYFPTRLSDAEIRSLAQRGLNM